jgi:hypothetical protein
MVHLINKITVFPSMIERVTSTPTDQGESEDPPSLSRARTFRSTIRRLTNESLVPMSRLSNKDMPAAMANTKRRKSTARNLRRQILETMAPQGDQSPKFVPHTALGQLLQEKDVIDFLQSHKFNVDLQDLASFICHSAPKIFAILARRQTAGLIEQFYKYDLGDDQLPFHINTQEDEFQAYTVKFDRHHAIENHPFNEDSWTENELDNICDRDQWQFLSPIFHEEQFLYDLHPQTIMPFIDQQCLSEKESLFSVVQGWRIHRDHLQTPNFRVRFPRPKYSWYFECPACFAN